LVPNQKKRRGRKLTSIPPKKGSKIHGKTHKKGERVAWKSVPLGKGETEGKAVETQKGKRYAVVEESRDRDSTPLTPKRK